MTGARTHPYDPPQPAADRACNQPATASAATAIFAALLVVYVVWGTTYFAIRVAIQSVPPLMMVGTRFLVAGGALFGVLRWRRAPAPTLVEWRSAALVGVLMWVVGNGGLAVAEQWVSSGLSALVAASVPLWAALFGGLWGDWPRRTEWIGLTLGAAGVVVLGLGDGLRASPIGGVVLLCAAASFALGSMWGHRLPMPTGLMGSATTMMTAGAVLLALSAATGERLVNTPSLKSLLALSYLIVFGAMVAASSYRYLLEHTRSTVATSYAFVNPVIAILVGHLLGGERVVASEMLALTMIVAAVALVVSGARRSTVAHRSDAHRGGR